MALKALGRSSSAPERYGVDILFGSRLGSVGIQRKEMNDFFASVADGRLVREYPLMNQLHIAVLVIEGGQRWSTEGYWLGGSDHSRRTWTREQYRSYLMSVQERGVWVVETDSLQDTAAYALSLLAWASKPSHTSLISRPKPSGAWGEADSRDWMLFLAQSFPGVGPTQAEKLVDHFGGVLPIAWTCTQKELGAAPGIGKGRLKKLWDALPRSTEGDEG